MIQRLTLTSLLTFTLVACSTTPPTADEVNARREASIAKYKATPKIFKGVAGFTAVPGTTKVIKTEIMRGEDFASREVNFRRTGVLQTEIRYGNFLHKNTIPAGAKLYASRYGVGRIGWCYPGKDDASFGESFMGKTKASCILKSLTGSGASLMGGSGGNSAFFTPKLMPPGQPGPIPDILEQKVDFGRTFTLLMRVNRVKKKYIIIGSVLNDGVERVQMGTHRIPRADDGSAILRIWGGEIKIRPNPDPKDKQVSLEVIKQPDDTDNNYAALQQALQLLLEDPATKEAFEKAIAKNKQDAPVEK